MDAFLIPLHNLIRWVLVLLMLIVLFRSYRGWLSGSAYVKADNSLAGSMVGMAHVQLLIGLLLYFAFSPAAEAARNTPGFMKDATLRLYAMEHPLTMFIAIVLLQLGRTFSKKKASDIEKHKTVAIYTTIAAVLIASRVMNWNLPAF